MFVEMAFDGVFNLRTLETRWMGEFDKCAPFVEPRDYLLDLDVYVWGEDLSYDPPG